MIRWKGDELENLIKLVRRRNASNSIVSYMRLQSLSARKDGLPDLAFSIWTASNQLEKHRWDLAELTLRRAYEEKEDVG